MDAELSFRVTDTSIDPYVRAFQPQFSPFTSAVASGTIRVVGELYNPDALRIDVEMDDVEFPLLRLRAEERRAYPDERRSPGAAGGRLRLVGLDTELDLAGSVDLTEAGARPDRRTGPRTWRCSRGSCPTSAARVAPRWPRASTGTVDAPVVSGTALLSDGRLRQFAIPHALEALNGIVTFNATRRAARRASRPRWRRGGAASADASGCPATR